ncbi:MAG TPA: DegT/DnrJ/EryC1/StrS family aminotransferase [Dehalococcoidia bacterium]|nr:DegT/DnrJ/EryC1/StrS family aminotransferase [Dehalococcoidia bacterium]
MIPEIDLVRENDSLKAQLEEAVLRAVASGRYILGPEVQAFEAEFADYCGAGYGVAVSSGTEALRLTLLALDFEPGFEVITVPFTAAATVAAIIAAGGRPVFVDIEPAAYVMDVSRVEAALSKRTRAIIPVHLFGHPVDMDPLLEIARRHGLFVLEDACQAHGAEYRGRKVGSLGDAACFSFYPTKNLGAMGDGGMVVTNLDTLAEKVRVLRNHGEDARFHHIAVSLNSRFDDIQAAVLRVKLRHLEEWNARRREIASVYTRAWEDLPLLLPLEQPFARSSYHRYVVHVAERDAFRQRLEALGIGSDVHYPLPVHLQPGFQYLGWDEGTLPVSEWAAQGVVTLPIYPQLTERETTLITRAVVQALNEQPIVPEALSSGPAGAASE